MVAQQDPVPEHVSHAAGPARDSAAPEAIEAAELLYQLLHAHKRAFHAVAKEYGLTPQQAATLWHLIPGDALPMNALADLLMCDASNVTGIVDKLELRGLAKRAQAADRRVKVLTLTPAGEAMRAIMRDKLLSPPRWLTGLSRDDQRAARDLLRRAADAARGASSD